MIELPVHARRVLHCLLLGAVLSLVACNTDDASTDASSPASASASAPASVSVSAPEGSAATPPPGVPTAAGLHGRAADAAGLHLLAERAMAERRLLDPAGDNALEYYLALRDAAPDDAATQNALSELQPYALIATEQALARGDALQAHRMVALLARSDPGAPALPRLHGELQQMEARMSAAALAERDAMAKLESDAATHARAAAAALDQAALARASAEQAALARAVQARATTPAVVDAAPALPRSATAVEPRPATPNNLPSVAAGAPIATSPSPSASASAGLAATTRRTVDALAPTPASTPVPAARPSSARTTMPRLVSDAVPRYPLIAINRGIEGSVVVAFTVQPDGSVSNARVQSATPPGVFDNAALSAAARWRFAPSGDSHATTRTLAFPLQMQPGGKRGPAGRPSAG